MSQHDMNIANSDGATVRADINSALVAIAENHSGATEPSTTFAYQWWADTATGNMKIRNAANSAWIVLWVLATGAHIQGADIASASALPVLADGVFNDVTGTTGITSIDSLGIGSFKIFQFDGALTITHHATNLILPGGKNIITVAGDVLCFYEYASGDWRLISNSADSFPFRKGSDVASTGALPVIESGAFDVTGTTGITSIDSVGIGAIILLRFDGIVTLTHHATNLDLGGSDITTVAGQILVLHEYASGDWRLVSNSVSGGVGTIPVFHVHKNGTGQSVATSTLTKVTWATEVLDTNNDFDIATNERFTPTVAGKYLLYANVAYTSIGDGKVFEGHIYKNGASEKVTRATAGSTDTCNANVCALVEANGSTDYFEVFANHEHGSNRDVNGEARRVYFMGFKIAE